MITILEGVGLLCTVFVIYHLVKKVFAFLYECLSGPINLQKQGKWAGMYLKLIFILYLLKHLCYC